MIDAGANARIPAIDQYYQQEFAARAAALGTARAQMRTLLLEAGLSAMHADMAVEQVMAGHPEHSQNRAAATPPDIRLPANADEQARKIEEGLARLCARLEPYLPISIYPNRSEDAISLRLIPWGGRSKVERALLASPLARSMEPPSAAAPRRTGGWRSRIVRQEPGGEPVGSEREELGGQLHTLADIRRRSHDLNPLMVFPTQLQERWVKAGLAGGTLELPITDPQARARPFYEELAADFAGLMQKRAGVDAGVLVNWEGDTLVVHAGLPKKE